MHIILKLTIIAATFSFVLLTVVSIVSYINSSRAIRAKKNKTKYPYPLLKEGRKLHVVSEHEMMERYEIVKKSINSCILPPQLATAYDMVEEFKQRYGSNSYYEILMAEYTGRSISIEWY